MLPYIIPLEWLLFYYYYIHDRIKDTPDLKYKVIACLMAIYFYRLFFKMRQAYQNKKKIMVRQKKSDKRFGDLQQRLQTLRESVNKSIPKLSYQELANKLRANELKPFDVLIAYQQKALSADEYTNSLVDTIHVSMKEIPTRGSVQEWSSHLFTSFSPGGSVSFTSVSTSVPSNRFAQFHPVTSLKDMLFRDRSVSYGGPSVSTEKLQKAMEECSDLLLGIPVCFSEVIQIQYMDATAGLSSFIDHPAMDDAVVVQLLRAQGAIPFMRTNVPQTAFLTFASSNPIFGMTRNPVKQSRSPGGASSGAAAIIAARGSILGVGTDQAGGIRIPAHFCGVCGLKPTSQRVSHKGVREVQSQNVVLNSVGALARDVTGLVAFMKGVCVPLHHTLDPTISVIPFNDKLYEKRDELRVGYYIDDGYTKCTPAVRKAVNEALEVLTNAGHSVVQFDPPDMKEMLTKLFLPTVGGDCSADIVEHLAIDILDPCVSKAYYFAQLPYVLRWLWSWWYHRKSPVDAAIISTNPPSYVKGWWELLIEIADWKQKFIKRWHGKGLDVIVCPVMPFAAVKLGTEDMFTGCLTYTAMYNLLDFPAGTISFRTVNQLDLDVLGNPDMYDAKTLLELRIKMDQLGDSDDPETSALDLPVGVQVVALPFEEEMVLNVLRQLEQAKTNSL